MSDSAKKVSRSPWGWLVGRGGPGNEQGDRAPAILVAMVDRYILLLKGKGDYHFIWWPPMKCRSPLWGIEESERWSPRKAHNHHYILLLKGKGDYHFIGWPLGQSPLIFIGKTKIFSNNLLLQNAFLLMQKISTLWKGFSNRNLTGHLLVGWLVDPPKSARWPWHLFRSVAHPKCFLVVRRSRNNSIPGHCTSSV